MATSINTNSSSAIAQNNLRASSALTQSSIARLSSGNKIIRASDDVAALSIGTILRTDVNTLKTALNNAAQGTTLLQVADGALARVGEIVQRQKTLATQALSGTLGDTERGYLNQEFQALKSELNRIVDTTNFNGVTLINGNLLAGGTGSQVTTEVATAAFSAQLTDTTDTILTTVLTGGAAALTLSNNGSTDNSALTTLFGSLADATVSVVDGAATDVATIVLTINGISYASATDAYDSDGTDTVVLTANDGSGVTLSLAIADLGYGTALSTAEATLAENRIEAEIRKLSLYQEKGISIVDSDVGSIVAADVEGTVLEGITGASISIQGKDGFSADPATKTSDTDTTFKSVAPAISNFRIVSLSSTTASFYLDVNGVTYSARVATVAADITSANFDFGTDADGNDLAVNVGELRLYNLDDTKSFVEIAFEDANDGLGLTTQGAADALAEAINKLLGGGVSGGASFAVGTDASDTISVSIGSVSTNKLYIDENDDLIELSVATSADATVASEVLDLAIQRITEVRANVGSLQSRFGYASATLETSITNLDAARGQFLDADISAESTAFANNQVLTQAAISVLAQANQLPQNLLKLIQ